MSVSHLCPGSMAAGREVYFNLKKQKTEKSSHLLSYQGASKASDRPQDQSRQAAIKSRNDVFSERSFIHRPSEGEAFKRKNRM